MNLIKERDARTARRLAKKRKLDEMIPLANTAGMWVPLIDEGVIITGDEQVDFIIMRGAAERFYERVPDDFEGHITMGHLDFAGQLPILLGTWTKEDLALVDLENGIKGIDVRLRLNQDLYLVHDLMAMPYTLGTSARLIRKFNQEWTDRLQIPVVEDFWINEFGIVGDAGNVRSSGLNLGGTHDD